MAFLHGQRLRVAARESQGSPARSGQVTKTTNSRGRHGQPIWPQLSTRWPATGVTVDA